VRESLRKTRDITRLPFTISVLSTLLLFGALPLVLADDQYSEDEVKAVFLYRFAGYVEWPKGTHSSETFVIAVFGAEGVAHKLEALLPGHLIKGHPATVKRITTIEDAKNSQMLFMGKDYGQKLEHFTDELASRSVLVVTDDEHGLNLGGTVNFMAVGNRVQFEISLPAAEASGLKIMSELLSVARRVQRGKEGSDVSCAPGLNVSGNARRCAELLFAQTF